MRNLRLLDAFRVENPIGPNDDKNGAFLISGGLRVIVSVHEREGWDHVSVSREDRIPTWTEMERVKRLFFKDEECAMQLHVPPADHVDLHPHCLHIWRPLNVPVPRPPMSLMIGGD